jgi:dTDP-4-dehydrorhamnose 3,5-epimerase
MSEFEAFGAIADGPTIDPMGRSVRSPIDGVLTRSVVSHVDHRGRVYELINIERDPEFWVDPVIASYVFTIRPGTMKGWGVHAHKDDRYNLITGEFMTILYDARFDSPTYQQIQEVSLSPEGIRQLLIPAGVWHININVAPEETMVVNFPTQPYRYGAPDRLTMPWYSENIPADIASYFPRQQLRPLACEACDEQ